MILCVMAMVCTMGCGNDTGMITANLVNLRSGPSTDSMVVARLYANQKVRIIEKQVMTTKQEGQGVIGKSGILNKQAYIYIGRQPYLMNQAKAVRIIGLRGSAYMVEVEVDTMQKAIGYVKMVDVEILNSNVWYRVRTENGQEGWVFERFIVRT
ncbi:MAG TPA: SH3 domain-containing protein [Spirochaetota bacterium]|nr:SH3 domain-containing protein [Spirochaetota bacterium]